MNFSAPYFPGFPPPINGTHAAPPSHPTGFHTSDGRSTGSIIESYPASRNSCPNCSSYHCKSDDENFLRAIEEGRNDYGSRLGWIWYCISEAAPGANQSDREQVWRSLVESDEIWSIWEDGDNSNLPVAPIPLVFSYPYLYLYSSQSGNFDFITSIISRRIDLHSKNRCSPKLTPSPSPESQNTSVHMRLAIVLWKTLLATRRVKYLRNPSSVNCEIPSLIPKWWGMLPEPVKASLVIDDRSWDRFHMEQKHRGHTCMEQLPEKEMWSTWITVQALISTSIPLDIPLNDKNCPQCLTLQEQPIGRAEFVKPHVLALWYIARKICRWNGRPYPHPDNIWDSSCIFSHYTSWYKTLNLGKSLFNQATLGKVDGWLTDIWSSSNDEFNNSDLRKHVGKTFGQTPFLSKWELDWNENDLEPHWTETQTVISKISSSESSDGSDSDSVGPASWVSAVVLFTLAKIYGLEPLTVQYFDKIIVCTDVGELLQGAPLCSKTPPSKKFHEALKRSGHTCWSEKSRGPNSLTNLYFSAYSLLLGISDVPVIGCEERDHWTKCAACHAKCAFHDFSLVLNEELLGPLESPSDKAKKGRVKRLIFKLNYAQYQKNEHQYCYRPLYHSDLMMLTKNLSSLSNLFQYALDNGKDINLFDDDAGEIQLGYGPNNGYSDDCDSESDPEEDTQSSSSSRPESSAQLSQLVSGHENDTLNFEHLENPAQPVYTVSEDNSSHAYHNNHPNFSTGQVVPHIQNVTEGWTTLSHPDYPPQLDTLFENDHCLQPPMPNQSGTDHTQPGSYSQTIDSPGLFTISNFNLGNGHAFPFHESGNSVQHTQQIDVSLNGSNIINPPHTNANCHPLPALGIQTFGDTPFIPETGTSRNTRPPRPPRVDKMCTEIKKQLISMLESKKIRNTAGKLPWRNLFKILREHKCEFENWPKGTPEPSTRNGIEKAPQDEIKAIYKALFDKERPLRIRRIDGQSGGADRIFIPQDPSGSGSGNKRGRDEQGSNVEEGGINRRRLRM
ncbi:hypothetical protein K435DRAFT_965461 [Dendrothele bispora CBS 962.96]|uniref:Uncharacterized protein n=1 Tax=Dendrothele bispora (strain CBS 962.96) TaxID=1314807 RepID=A0A4S8M5E5_DENBC|nr:hypothetical protein K435DRAFT_965461 [Dendrothele bispora CBS 962.96]